MCVVTSRIISNAIGSLARDTAYPSSVTVALNRVYYSNSETKHKLKHVCF